MNARELAVMWLRDRAATLRNDATKVDRAYQLSPLRDACAHVAKAYRAAADVLAHAADNYPEARP